MNVSIVQSEHRLFTNNDNREQSEDIHMYTEYIYIYKNNIILQNKQITKRGFKYFV